MQGKTDALYGEKKATNLSLESIDSGDGRDRRKEEEKMKGGAAVYRFCSLFIQNRVAVRGGRMNAGEKPGHGERKK